MVRKLAEEKMFVASLYLLLWVVTLALYIVAHPGNRIDPLYTMLAVTITLSLAASIYWRYAHLTATSVAAARIQPIFWMLIWSVVMFMMPAIIGILDPEILDRGFNFIEVSLAYSALGLVMLLMGMLTIWLGFDIAIRVIRPGQVLRRWTARTPRESVLVIFYIPVAALQVILLATVGSAISTDISALGPLAPLYQPIRLLGTTNLLIISFLAVGVFRGHGRVLPFLLILFTQIGLELASGFRSPIIFLVIIVGISALYAGVNILRAFAPLMLLLIPATLVLPMSRQFRTAIREGNDITSSVVLSFQNTWGSGFGSAFGELGQNLALRQTFVAHIPGVVLRRTPSDFPHLGWGELLQTPRLVIPRVFWPSKPEVSIGTDFSWKYLNYPSEIVTSSPTTLFGEGFMYAGWAGVLVVCLFVGIMIAFVYKLFMESNWAPVGIAVLPHFLSLESQYLTIVFAAFQSLVVFIIVIRVLTFLSDLRVVNSSANTGSARGRPSGSATPAQTEQAPLL